MKQIKIVRSVQRTAAANLRGMVRLSQTDVSIPEGIEWERLEIKPHAQLIITDKQEGKNTIWNAKLTFKTCQDTVDRDKYAYLCELTNGQYRLIGTDERPFPALTVQESMPENVADNQLNEVTVNWQSPRFIPSVRDI